MWIDFVICCNFDSAKGLEDCRHDLRRRHIFLAAGFSIAFSISMDNHALVK